MSIYFCFPATSWLITDMYRNLQCANHVIFLSPMLANTQYDYESTMTQAIGRSHRFGQLKEVHVYHFLALSTIDVNIIQDRRQKVLFEKDDGCFELVARGEVGPDITRWEGASLDGENAGYYSGGDDLELEQVDE